MLIAFVLALRVSAAEPEEVLAGTPSSGEAAGFAATATDEIHRALATTDRLLAEARARRDGETIACIQRKRIPLQVLATLADEAARSVGERAAAHDDAGVGLASRRVAVALARTRDLVLEARICAAQASRGVEPTDPGFEPVPVGRPLMDDAGGRCGDAAAAASPC